MTVYEVLKKLEPSQKMRIVDEQHGIVEGIAISLCEMINPVILVEKVELLRAKDDVMVLEVAEE